jgi:hypothetical protein
LIEPGIAVRDLAVHFVEEVFKLMPVAFLIVMLLHILRLKLARRITPCVLNGGVGTSTRQDMRAVKLSKARRMTMWFGGAVLAGLLLSACNTTPVPELQKIALTATAPELPQDRYDECLRDAGRFPADSPARYSPSATYTFASTMHRNVERVRVLAPRVRAYTPVHPKADVICYYDGGDANLRYLTYIRSNQEGRAHFSEINRAILVAYAKLAGKNVTKIYLFGVYAD